MKQSVIENKRNSTQAKIKHVTTKEAPFPVKNQRTAKKQFLRKPKKNGKSSTSY
jgi:hypothetical protein